LRAPKSLVAALKGIEKVSPGVNCKKLFVVINVVPQVTLKVLDSSHSYHDKSIFFPQITLLFAVLIIMITRLLKAKKPSVWRAKRLILKAVAF